MATYSKAQRQLDTHTRSVGSAPEGDTSATRYEQWVPIGILPVSSKACL